jgi:NADP-dependent 3-hydroxy acid dehydrogenase YdfG
MKFQFDCDGKYEAEKLAALVSVQKGDTVYVAGVTALVGSEVVIKLKDKSSHAVVLKDRKNAERLEALLKDIASGKATVLSSDFSGSQAEITVKD